MKTLTLRLIALVIALLSASCGKTQTDDTAHGLRTITKTTLHSEANPKLTLTPAAEFVYAGDFSIILKDKARAERHHWVALDGDKIEKLLIVQFEGFLEDIEGQYRFSVPSDETEGSNYKFTKVPLPLGGADFIHNTWALDHAANARANPGMEAEATLNLLREKGYVLDDELIMSRFVQAFGKDNRHELIIFYFEPLASHGKSIADFPDGGPITEDYASFSDTVTARSLASFSLSIEDE